MRSKLRIKRMYHCILLYYLMNNNDKWCIMRFVRNSCSRAVSWCFTCVFKMPFHADARCIFSVKIGHVIEIDVWYSSIFITWSVLMLKMNAERQHEKASLSSWICYHYLRNIGNMNDKKSRIRYNNILVTRNRMQDNAISGRESVRCFVYVNR